MAKHSRKSDTRQIIRLKDYQQPQETETRVEYEYEDEEEQAEEEKREHKIKISRAAYRVAIILLVLVLGLAVWVNREKLAPQKVLEWAKLQIMGSGQGDGFPVSLTGSQVAASNFTVVDGKAMILSDTALTAVDPSGRELLSLRHNLHQPAMRTTHGKTLLFNAGSIGYMVLSGVDTKVSAAADREILAGAVAQNGRFALGLEGAHGASELNVFLENGSLQYKYPFAEDYITAIALNYDGTCGVVCTVRSDRGELISKVTVFDFNQEEPLAAFETTDNYLIDAAWTESGDLYAVGNTALLLANSSRYEFTDYDYEGRLLTAYRLDQGRAFLSISAYEHAGPCTLLVFRGDRSPTKIESPQRIVSLSVSGGTVGALTDGKTLFYDYSAGTELGRTDAGSDAKSIALYSEKAAYVLGVSEIRTVEIE